MRRAALVVLVLGAIGLVIVQLIGGSGPHTPRRAQAPRTNDAKTNKPTTHEPENRKPKTETRHQAHLMGMVVDKDGQPIAGARIRVTNMDNTAEWDKRPDLVTDADGRFRHKAKSSMHELMVTAEGYGERYLRTFPDDPDLRIVMHAECTLAGVIHTPDGRPVSKAELSFWDSNIHATADDEGRFEITGIRSGPVTMHCYWGGPVAAPGAPETWWRWDWHFTLKPGEEQRDLKLTLKGARYSWLPLKLVDEKGKPRAGAIIEDEGSFEVLEQPGAPVVYDEVFEVYRRVTDKEGFVLLRGQDQPGYQVDLEIRHGGWLWKRTVFSRDPGTKDVVTVTLPRPRIVTVRVLDETGKPIPSTSNPDVTLSGVETGLTKARGNDGERFDFRVDAGEEGYLELEVQADGYATFVDWRWKPEPFVEVRLRREARVRGRILDMPPSKDKGDGKTQSVHVWVGNPFHGGEGLGEYVRPNMDGTFELARLTPGRSVVRGFLHGFRETALRRVVTLTEGDNDLGDMRLKPVRKIRGRVVDAEGRGVGGAWVQMLELGRSANDGGLSKPDGSFEVELFETDTFVLLARKSGFASALTPIGEDIVVYPSPSIRLWSGNTPWSHSRLRGPDGRILRVDRMSFFWAFQEDGLELLNLPLGKWKLELVYHSDVVTRSAPVELVPGGTVKVDLR